MNRNLEKLKEVKQEREFWRAKAGAILSLPGKSGNIAPSKGSRQGSPFQKEKIGQSIQESKEKLTNTIDVFKMKPSSGIRR